MCQLKIGSGFLRIGCCVHKEECPSTAYSETKAIGGAVSVDELEECQPTRTQGSLHRQIPDRVSDAMLVVILRNLELGVEACLRTV
jgi:hypothetical protein